MNWFNRLWGKRSPLYLQLVRWSKRASLPGFGGISLFYFFRFFAIRLSNESLNMRASSIAFNFFLALIPALIFLFTLLPYIPIENLHNEILHFLNDLLPNSAYYLIYDTVVDILQTQRGGLLSFGVILTLYYSMNGFYSLLEAFDKNDPRGFWKKRGISLSFTFIIPLLLILGITILIAGEVVLEYLQAHHLLLDRGTYILLLLFKWLIFFLILLTAISLLYYYGTHRGKRWRVLMPGAFFAAFIMMASTLAFSQYVENFSQYNKLFGSLGTLIVIMILLYINALVMVIGYEINDVILISRKFGPGGTLHTPDMAKK